jgi:hypothetical protein
VPHLNIGRVPLHLPLIVLRLAPNPNQSGRVILSAVDGEVTVRHIDGTISDNPADLSTRHPTAGIPFHKVTHGKLARFSTLLTGLPSVTVSATLHILFPALTKSTPLLIEVVLIEE